jgi:hypothetical protein
MSVLSPSGRDQPTLLRSVPWRADDLIRWISASALASVLIVVGWYVAAGQAGDSRQVVPLNLAVGGAVVGGVANLAWLLRGWHAVGERRKALARLLLTDVPGAEPEHSRSAESERASASVGMLVGEGSRYFHRPSCPLAAGRSWQPAPLAAHLKAGREPCGVCEP